MAIACQNPFYSSLSSSPSSSSLSSSLSSQFSSLSSLLSSKRGSSAWISMSRHRVSPLSSLKLLEAEVKRRTAPSLEPYMNHIQICNSGLEKKAFLLPFVFDGQVIGYIHPKFAEHLGDFEEVLDVDKSGGWRRERLKLRLNPSFETREERSDAMDYVAKELHKKGLLPKPHGEAWM
ncbi:nudix hydrolase 24, chloroplastic-like [Amborella trichopoda]|nr:nudix hydrolase 24, chloroplastic-like [Amborella trichopoda]|eukprot:XP_020519728.1 nudix hydrolase 24, chloroplastic-like [Amborella trichopoda]